MAGKYFNKSNLVDFFKRFATSELQQHPRTANRSAGTNEIIQKESSFWPQAAWNHYRKQLQATVGRLVGSFETGFQQLGRQMPASGRRSLRQVKKNVLQLMADSRQRIRQLEKEFVRIRDSLPYRERANLKFRSNQQRSTDSVGMMEEGKIENCLAEVKLNMERVTQNYVSQYNRDTTLVHKPRYTGRPTNDMKPSQTRADLHNSMSGVSVCLTAPNQCLKVNEKILQLASETAKPESAVSLRTTEADVPKALTLTVKTDEVITTSNQRQAVLNKSSY
ncbi:uncharacterized protein LOC128866351 isoform X1 [Anastrepha ludens]|uniref:uncharacterized protein LOC128866351 isoform X1 n=1 Tax=Anastrepha ludens TaxID=28586 RepID=UPI0023AEAEA3|nr:uncharacterized protein LOC128866351 isoform X1 [Anastrepha ludens]